MVLVYHLWVKLCCVAVLTCLQPGIASAGSGLQGDPVHIITGRGNGLQFTAVRQRLAYLRKEGVISNYWAVNGGGFHVLLT